MEGSTLLGGEQKTSLCAEFAKAAEDAFRQWRYAPAKKAGKAVCLYATVKFDFRPD
jgi:outer membrane biosynthesis protein TonB